MRGTDDRTEGLFSYVSCEARVPAGHPLRPVRAIVDEALEVLSAEFEEMYAPAGRPSIPPEKLLRALLLQAFYSIRSERQLMEQLDYNLLFRWFVGLHLDDSISDVTVLTKNRERLMAGEVSQRSLAPDQPFSQQVALETSVGLKPFNGNVLTVGFWWFLCGHRR